ncbi:MAG: peptide ABC transporter substrate-binding protein [Desulfobacteraceae bacterium]|nr:peptide ABC transporter substrate-binding protein [Desulfobacteraceae bacterium]
MRRILCFFVFSALLAIPASGVSAASQEIMYVVNNEADLYDPGVTNETFAMPVVGNAFEGLVKLDEIGNVVPAAAGSWDISADGLVYTFHLRKNLKWSDGKPLTALDFEYAWKRVLTPKTGAKYADLLFYIKNGKAFFDGETTEKEVGVSAVDDHTLRMELGEVTPYMLQLMTFWVYCPVRKDMVEKDPEGWSRKPELYISNGPFKVAEMNIGKSMVLVKNEHYWNAGKVKLNKVTFRVIPELSTALAAMEAGDVDGIEDVPPAEIPRLMVESKAFSVIPSLGSRYAFLNSRKPPLNDVRVRQALAKAIDRMEIIDHVLQSSDVPGMALVPPGLGIGGADFREAGGNYGLTENAQVDEAKKLLADAGYPDGKGFPVLDFKYYSHPVIKKLVEATAQMWKKNLNIDSKISNMEWKVYYPEVQKLNYDVAMMGWGADYPHPMTFLDVFLKDGANNHSSWGSVEYDKFVALAKQAVEVKKALEYMHKAEDVLMNDMAILTFHYRAYNMMMSERVKEWRRSSMGAIYFENAYIE